LGKDGGACLRWDVVYGEGWEKSKEFSLGGCEGLVGLLVRGGKGCTPKVLIRRGYKHPIFKSSQKQGAVTGGDWRGYEKGAVLRRRLI